jgi:hypothetical protein
MTKRARYQLYGWVAPGPKPKESDGVKYLLCRCDSLELAEAARYERLKAGWGRVEIVDVDPTAAEQR